MNKKLPFLFIITIFLLGGCSSVLDSVLTSTSPEVVLKKAVEAHERIESLEVSFEENLDDFTDTGLMKVDFKNGESYITLDKENIAVYIDDTDVLVEYSDGEVESWGGTQVFVDLENKVKYQQNPLLYFTNIDETIFDKFEMEKEKGKFILTYNGTSEDKQLLGKALAYYDITGMDDYDVMLDYFDIEIGAVDLKLVVDSASFLLEKMEQNLVYTFADEEKETITGLVQEFGNYDNVGEITQLVATVKDGEGFNKTEKSGDVADVSEEEIKKYETEAATYLEALIQATVFQDAEGFIKKAPDSMSEDDKKDEAEIQRDFFKEIYVQNTKDNMAQTGVTDEEVLGLTDAFLHALATTKYEVVHAKAKTPENIVVTISVQGIDETEIYKKTEDEMYDVIVAGKVAEDELISKNMEILIRNYRDINTLLDPVEVDVNVTREGDNYVVMTQDEFLVGGFVQ